ncbi:MAG: hypothetical protein IJC34_00570 [Lentisphaeria bacterium]|nr:hypothetical protein [Lentisphaeria bacterium]
MKTKKRCPCCGCEIEIDIAVRVSDASSHRDWVPNARELNAQPGDPAIDGATDLSGCDKVKSYSFTGKRVCITGKFSISRAELTSRLQEAGAEVVTAVSEQLDALLIGGAASAGWSGGSFGNKMAEAALIRQYKSTPLLLAEDTVMECLNTQRREDELF